MTLVEQEPLVWLARSGEKYDVIIVDTLDPTDYREGKNYTTRFYRLLANRLQPAGVAAILSLMLSATISRPIEKLRSQAKALVDRRGRLTGRFPGSNRFDEIGDLSRALSELSEGERATVRRVPDGDSDLLRYLTSLSLVPGCDVELRHAAPFGGPVTVAGDAGEHAISRELATLIGVG